MLPEGAELDADAAAELAATLSNSQNGTEEPQNSAERVFTLNVENSGEISKHNANLRNVPPMPEPLTE